MKKLVRGFTAKKFKRYIQWDEYSCGARSTQMVLEHFMGPVEYRDVKKGVKTTRDGTHFEDVAAYLRTHGFTVKSRRGSVHDAVQHLSEQSVVLASVDDEGHVLVLHGAELEGSRVTHVQIADPAYPRAPRRRYAVHTFAGRWSNHFLVVRYAA